MTQTSKAVEVLPEAGRPNTTKALDMAGGLTLDEVKLIGTVFFQSGMFTDIKSTAQAITKVLAGQEMGIPPLAAIRGLYVTKRGTIEMMSALMAAQVKRSGKYRYDVVEATDQKCVIAWSERMPDGSWRDLKPTQFTTDDAKKAGLVGKDTYKAYGEDMLFNRALARGARRHCPDVFVGAIHSVGETIPEDFDKPEPFVQRTPTGGYTPPRVAHLHESSAESRSASSIMPEGAAHTATDDAPRRSSEVTPSGTELFPPSQDELDALAEDAAQHRDPTDEDPA